MERDAEALAELRALLMERWDPIGVSDAPEAYDEYDRYLRPLGKLLEGGGDAETLATYLSGIQTDWMELPATPEDLMGVAAEIVGWYRARGPSRPSE